MNLLTSLKDIAGRACPDYTFVFDTNRMMNVDADDVRFPVIYMDEYYDRRLDYSYGYRDVAVVELSFMRLVPMHGDAEHREEVREQMRTEAVRPFLKELEASGLFESIERSGSSISSPNEPTRFDANCVSVFLRMTLTFREEC